MEIPIIFKNDRNAFQVAEQSDQLLFTYNLERANTRVGLHAYLKDTNCVVVSRDNDVFVLMVFVFAFKNNETFLVNENRSQQINK